MISIRRFAFRDFRAAEAVKALRANLSFHASRARVIALTSTDAAAGKTTLAFQLSLSLAQQGSRVLLLDCDLRRSSLASHLSVLPRPQGLCQYFYGLENVSELVCRTDVEGLYFLFAGGRMADPTQSLSGEAFRVLLDALRKTFDYVIVDTAPLGQVIDCALLAPLVDGVVTVIDARKNSWGEERRLCRRVEAAGGRMLGAVLNRAECRERGSYYGN